MKKINLGEITNIAKEFNYPLASVRSVLSVESGGKGFDDTTGKIIIQFEPSWFKRKAPYTPSGKWSLNGVERQAQEWIAFNDAFSKNPEAAMESTSWGMMQVMGFNWKLLGFTSVGAMVDYAKESEANQLRLGLMYIQSNKTMATALRNLEFGTFAYFYNGRGYKEFKYDTRLQMAYEQYS